MATLHVFATECLIRNKDKDALITSIRQHLEVLKQRGFVEYYYFNDELEYFHGLFYGHGGYFEEYISSLSQIVNFVTISNENDYSVNMDFGGAINKATK